MKKLRAFIYVLKNSLTNFDYYSGLKNVRLTFSLKYLLGFLSLTTIISLIPFLVSLVQFYPQLPAKINDLKLQAENAYPKDLVLTLKDGQLFSNKTDAYYFGNFLVIDTTASASDYFKYKEKYPILITKNEIIAPDDTYPLSQIKDNTTLDYASYLSGIKSLEVYADYFQKYYAIIAIVGLAFFIFLLTLFTFIWTLVSLAIFTLFVYIILSASGKKLPFNNVYKIVLHASSLPTLFFTILAIVNLRPTIPFGYSLILGLFLFGVFHRLWKINS